MKLLTTLVIPAGLLSAACSTAPVNCDPSVSRDIFTTAACVGSGANDVRVQERQSELTRIQIDASSLEGQRTTLAAQNQYLLAERASLQSSIAITGGRIQELRNEIVSFDTVSGQYGNQAAALASEATSVQGVTGLYQSETRRLDLETQQLLAEADRLDAELARQRALPPIETDDPAKVVAAQSEIDKLNREIENLRKVSRLRRR